MCANIKKKLDAFSVSIELALSAFADLSEAQASQFLCLVLSIRLYLIPGFGAGGRGLPLVEVISPGNLPPRGPILSY